jgi:hypothetical protein
LSASDAVLFEDGDALGLEGFAAVGIAEGHFEFGAEGDAGRRGVERAAEIGPQLDGDAAAWLMQVCSPL